MWLFDWIWLGDGYFMFLKLLKTQDSRFLICSDSHERKYIPNWRRQVSSTWCLASAVNMPFRTRVLKDEASNAMLKETIKGNSWAVKKTILKILTVCFVLRLFLFFFDSCFLVFCCVCVCIHFLPSFFLAVFANIRHVFAKELAKSSSHLRKLHHVESMQCRMQLNWFW